ncbi:hypothetical protein [Natronorubrum sp. FCH18a]|uniref:hypothetical protein n=1 Tax=Natronorubrum sp. FCH18a TaxID=3447018 RepID=UPI003F513980
MLPTTTEFLESGETLVLRLSVPTLEPKSADSSVDTVTDDALGAIRDLLAVSERIAERTG